MAPLVNFCSKKERTKEKLTLKQSLNQIDISFAKISISFLEENNLDHLIISDQLHDNLQEVNIGAFPLRPKEKENRSLLCDFIHSLITDKGQELIEDAIPLKGLNYIIDGVGTDSDMTFVGYIHKPEEGDSQAYQDYYNSFLNNDSPKLYYSGKHLQNDIDLRSVKYVFTNEPGNGYYRVKRIFSALRQDIIEDKAEKDPSMRICFELGDFISLGQQKIQFDMISEGQGLHIPAEGKFISLKLVKDLYNEISESPLKI